MECKSFLNAMSRRQALQAGFAGLIPWLLSSSSLAQVKLGKSEHTLVVLFLRGGADGLNMLVPFQEDEYYRLRPTLSIGAPNDSKRPVANRGVALTDRFALHPTLAPFKPWFESGEAAFAHAVGSEDRTRSHFEAMSAMERGASTGHSGEPSGWLARYLTLTSTEQDTPLRAVAWADTVPDSFRGAPSPLVVQSISDFQLNTDAEYMAFLKKQYTEKNGFVGKSGKDTLEALAKIEKLDAKNYKPDPKAEYPDSPLGKGFREVASLIKSQVGLEIASLEDTGWDNHAIQGAETGSQATSLTGVAKSVDAFMHDLGSLRKQVTLIVMTEFGRRVEENKSLGTDHGRASVMMAFGAIPGGKIYGDWPGLGKDQVDSVGDLKPVNDYRKMLNFFLEPHFPSIPKVWS
jgi:uncharacterized protein (DUF1501 family)